MSNLESDIPKYCKVIAEIGINHNGDIEIAKKLIDMAKNVDAMQLNFKKEQLKLFIQKSYLMKKGKVLGELLKESKKEGLEFSEKEFDEIDDYCKKINIEWFASAWDIPSLDFLDKYKPQNQKIASAMISNEKFLNAVASKKIHTYISTGMTNPSMIDKAIKYF